MKNAKKNLVLIVILLLVTLTALTACNIEDAIKVDIENCQISFSAESYEYTGEAIIPKITVKYGNRVLQNDVDYSVEYANNVDVGKGYVRITGIGNFKGAVVKNFDIVKKNEDKNYLLYTFHAPNAEVDSGELNQIVESVDQLVVPEVSKRGYKFLYWTYKGNVVDFDDKESLPDRSAQFVAEFELITYTIEYVLNGGVNSNENKEEFTVEDPFELKEATRNEKKFAGWYLDNNFQEKITSLSGVARDLVLYAKYVNVDDTMTLSYVLPSGVDASKYQEQTLYPGDALTRPAEVLSQDKSKKLVWYIDEAMTVRNNLSFMPDNDLTLYARWEDRVYAGFLDRGWYNITDIKTISSYEDMLAYVEFVLYYNITDVKTKNVTYVSGKENIKSEIAKALVESSFPRMLSVSYTYEKNACSVYMASKVTGQATLAATDKEDYYPQLGNVFNNYKSNRSSTFDDFAIEHLDKIEKGYECTTSDQLFYVLSHGYYPILSSSSAASRAYKQLKIILRSICDDSMSDLQKARAIYDWLILNVYYDNNVAYGNLPQAAYKYNAFYIEGVLNGAAVCDGLSKAYSAMCAIEGIDCVRITGKKKDAGAQDAGHAWNKIQLMGQWYLTDATWGNMVLEYNGKPYEYVKEEYFLFTDDQRANVDNYNSDQYTQYVADTQFTYYSRFKMQLEVKTSLVTTAKRSFDLYIDGDAEQGFTAVTEMSYVFEFIDRSGVSLEGMSVGIMLGEQMSLDKINEALNMYVNRVGNSKARISRYIAFGNVDDIVNSKNGTYRKGSIITIVFSFPQSNSTSQSAA